jgi:hypothetical protein
MPFFIVASGVGLIDMWRRLAGRSRRTKRLALGVVVTIGIYCVIANVAIAAFPVSVWTPTQSARFVSAEKSLSVDSLAASVRIGAKLPYWAPAGELFATNDCSGLYLSTGDDLKTVPGQRIEHLTWLPVEQSASFTHTIGFTFNRSESGLTSPVPLMTYGASTLVLISAGPGYAQVRIDNPGTAISWPLSHGWSFPVASWNIHEQLRIVVTTDPNLNSIRITYDGVQMLLHYIKGAGPAEVQTTAHSPNRSLPLVSVANLSSPSTAGSNMTLCRSLVGSH